MKCKHGTDTYIGMPYEEWVKNQRCKGMKGRLGGDTWREMHRCTIEAEKVAAEGMLGCDDQDHRIDPLKWLIKPDNVRLAQEDAHNPELPDIDDYDEMLKTAEGRAEIRRIRQEQLKHHQSTTDGRRVRKDEVVD